MALHGDSMVDGAGHPTLPDGTPRGWCPHPTLPGVSRTFRTGRLRARRHPTLHGGELCPPDAPGCGRHRARHRERGQDTRGSRVAQTGRPCPAPRVARSSASSARPNRGATSSTPRLQRPASARARPRSRTEQRATRRWEAASASCSEPWGRSACSSCWEAGAATSRSPRMPSRAAGRRSATAPDCASCRTARFRRRSAARRSRRSRVSSSRAPPPRDGARRRRLLATRAARDEHARE
jgi:hypothetical protein